MAATIKLPTMPGAKPAAKPATRAAPKVSILRGVQSQPEWIVVFGPPGIGKSTLAANAPSPVFVDLEGGSATLDVARANVVNDDGTERPVESWEELLGVIQALTDDAQGCQTLVLDTLDKAEWLCQQYVMRHVGDKNGKPTTTMESVAGGFGKGYIAVYEEFRRMLGMLQVLRSKRRVRALFLAHAKVQKVPNTSGPDYERWELKVHKQIAGLFFEAADAVLYACYDVAVSAKEGERPRGFGNVRQVRTHEEAGFMAKNRFGMESPLPLSWDVIADSIMRGNSPALLADTIRQRVSRLTDDGLVQVAAAARCKPEEVATRIEAKLTTNASNVAALVDLSNWLAANTPAPIEVDSTPESDQVASDTAAADEPAAPTDSSVNEGAK